MFNTRPWNSKIIAKTYMPHTHTHIHWIVLSRVFKNILFWSPEFSPSIVPSSQILYPLKFNCYGLLKLSPTKSYFCSTQISFQTLPIFLFPSTRGFQCWKLNAVSLGNYRDYLVFSFLRDYYSSFLDVQCLPNHCFKDFFIFYPIR